MGSEYGFLPLRTRYGALGNRVILLQLVLLVVGGRIENTRVLPIRWSLAKIINHSLLRKDLVSCHQKQYGEHSVLLRNA